MYCQEIRHTNAYRRQQHEKRNHTIADEIEAIANANKSLNTCETVSHEDVNWD